MASQGISPNDQDFRIALVTKAIPLQLGGIGLDLGRRTNRVHKVADARVTGSVVAGLVSRVPMWPSQSEKELARRLAPVYSLIWYGWLVWSEQAGLVQPIDPLDE